MMHDTNVSNATVIFANDVSKSAATFIAKLNSHPAVPRSFTVELTQKKHFQCKTRGVRVLV